MLDPSNKLRVARIGMRDPSSNLRMTCVKLGVTWASELSCALILRLFCSLRGPFFLHRFCGFFLRLFPLVLTFAPGVRSL